MRTSALSSGNREELTALPAPAPPIDVESLFSRCMGNVSFAFTLLDELESSGMQQVEEIVFHAVRNEPHSAAFAAHTLKGMMAIMGAEPVSSRAEAIEALVRHGDTSLLLELANDLRNEMNRCLAYIPTLRKAHNVGQERS